MDPLLTVAAIVLAGVGIIAGFIAYYDYTETQPKADAQLKHIQTLTCEQVLSFPSNTPMYSKENRIVLNEKNEQCTKAKQLEAQKEKERLDALLADPNSYESLSREYLKLTESLPELQNKYDTLKNETSILQEKITNATTRLSQVKEKMNENGWPFPDSEE